jgi:3-dehydrotetronate 4-kinase
MTIVLGGIADDYTGASDLANTLTRQGFRTIQTIGVPEETFIPPDADALVISLKSRNIAAAKAVTLCQNAFRWLRTRGAQHILFKICSTFDSTDKGNIGPVMDALRLESGTPIVAVTPSFPTTNRTVFQGHLFVGHQPLNESPLRDHPLNPMRDSDLVRILARQSNGKIGLVPVATVEAGAQAIRDALDLLAAQGHAAAILDAIFERHLEAIGEAVSDQPLSVGASGLGLGLSHSLRTKMPGPTPAVVSQPRQAPLGFEAIVAGSCSQATREQIAVAERSMPVRRLSAERLLTDGDSEVLETLAWAAPHLPEGAVLVASSGTPEEVAHLQRRHGVHAAGRAIEQWLAALSEGLVRAGVTRLVIAGGETSGAVVDRLGLPAFEVGREIAPGVPVLRTVGAAVDLVLALKSGNFGSPDFFAQALTALKQSA